MFLAGSSEFYTGGERQFIEICKVWRKSGNEICIIADNVTVALCKKFGLTANFHLFKKARFKIGGLEDFITAINMLNAIPNFSFDFIYCPEEKFLCVLASVALKKKFKAPLICGVNLLSPEDTGITSSLKQVFACSEARSGTIYIGDVPGRLFFFFKKMLRNFLLFKKVDLIFSVSPHIKKLLIKLGVNERRIFVINVGVDYSLVRKIATKTSTHKKFDACFLGSIIPRKGVIDLIKAWKIVTTEKPDARLLIIGKGDGLYFEKVKSLVKKYNLQENIIFSGFVPEVEKYKLLSQSKIFVFPSYLEGSPLALCEAIACGIPVIAYDLPNYKGAYGDMIIYVDKGDVKQLAVSVLKLLKDESFREKLKGEYIKLTKSYSWDDIAKYELHVIRKYLLDR